MKWMRERDALIAQTLAFVQSVTGGADDLRRPDEPAAPAVPTVEVMSLLAIEQSFEIGPLPEAVPPPPQPLPVAPPRAAGGDFRNEIQARVANFRKHQQRFEREREEYCTQTLAKLRATIGETPPRPPAGK